MKTATTNAALAVLLLPLLAIAQDPPSADPGEAMMAAFQASMTPGEQHAMLAGKVGRFTATVKSFEDPSGEPVVSESEVVRTMELGGRVLHETWTGEVMGMPFEGIGRTGYDNVTGRFWTTWTDNLSTGLFLGYGDWDPAGLAMEFHGQMPDPMTGTMIDTRSVAWDTGDGVEHMAMFREMGGQEVKIMEFELRRR